MPIGRCLRTHSNRQLLAWLKWLDEQMSTPDRGDWYLMQIACEVRRFMMKDPGRVKPEDFRLRFERPGQKRLTREEATAWSKARWFAAAGLDGEGRPR
jgi:hypothetical protein